MNNKKLLLLLPILLLTSCGGRNSNGGKPYVYDDVNKGFVVETGMFTITYGEYDSDYNYKIKKTWYIHANELVISYYSNGDGHSNHFYDYSHLVNDYGNKYALVIYEQ